MALKFLDRRGLVMDQVIVMNRGLYNFFQHEGGLEARVLRDLVKIGDVVLVDE
jgi:hypothetical protein